MRFELNEGKLDDGTQYVSKDNLLRRRVPNVAVGEDRTYGMGLQVDRDYGVSVVHHGGSLAGYTSDVIVIPSADVGAVILVNSNSGRMLLRPFIRRLLELLYDGKPEAAEDVAASAARSRAELADERSRVSVVPNPAEVLALAPEYANSELGRLRVRRDGQGVTFEFGALAIPMGTRKNDDGTISLVSIGPTLLYFPFVVGTDGSKPSLLVRDNHHEYRFVATK